MAESFLTVLPLPIVAEILSRLPLKTLLVCQCTCKTFLNLISFDLDFFAAHSSNADPVLILQSTGSFNPPRQLQLIEPEFDLWRKFNFLSNGSFHLPRIRGGNGAYYEEREMFLVNSCNGLLYLVRKNDALNKASVVCNPVTKEYIMIPEVHVESRTWIFSMWLGFCPLSNQYKVVRISESANSGDRKAKIIVVGSNSWIDVKGVIDLFDYSWDAPHTLLDGVIYWLDDHYEGQIIFFDFEAEKFGEIALPEGLQLALPDYDRFKLLKCMNIGVLGSCLCLIFIDYEYAHTWIMKRDENGESWAKQFVFDCNASKLVSLGTRIWPLQVLKNGDIFMLWLDNFLCCYNPRNKSLRQLFSDEPVFRGSYCARAVTLKPKFVPLKDILKVDEGFVKHTGGDEEDLCEANKKRRTCTNQIKRSIHLCWTQNIFN